MTKIGKRLKIARIKANLTLQESADLVGVDRVTIGNWESGRHYPNAVALEALSNAYGVAVGFFFGQKFIHNGADKKEVNV